MKLRITSTDHDEIIEDSMFRVVDEMERRGWHVFKRTLLRSTLFRDGVFWKIEAIQ